MTDAYQATGGLTFRSAADRALGTDVHINEFYPPLKLGQAYDASFGWKGTLANDKSNPLSNFYEVGADALEDYPFLADYGIADDSMADDLRQFETDWCAWMAAFLYVYERDKGMATAIIRAQGRYVINRTLACALYAPRIVGEGNAAIGTVLKYNGPNGTVDDPVYMIAFMTVADTVDMAPIKQPGSAIGQQASGGCSPSIANITFVGKHGKMSGLVGDESGYISGIRIGRVNMAEVNNCNFTSTLWDGICVTGVVVFVFIDRCVFQGVYRDGVSFCAQGIPSGRFSTTMYVRDNTFVLVGRYAILLNLFNTIGAAAIITGNLFEPSVTAGYFKANPAWYVQGVPAQVCMLGCGFSYFGPSYLELGRFHLAFLHIVNPGLQTVEFVWGGADSPDCVLSAFVNTGSVRSQAAIDYYDSRGFCDVTDQRNYPAGSKAGGQQAGLGTIKFSGMGNIHTLGGIVLSDVSYIDTCNIGSCLDYTVDHENTMGNAYGPIAALAVCEKGSINGTTLTVDETERGMMFDVGQLIWTCGVNSSGSITKALNPSRAVLPPGPYTITGGEAGTFELSAAPGNCQPSIVYGIVTEQRTLDQVTNGAFSGAAVGAPMLSSLKSKRGQVVQQPLYGRMERVLEARYSAADNKRELMLFNEVFLRCGNNFNPDASGAATFPDYVGLTLNRSVVDMTGPDANIYDLPMWFANVSDKDGKHVRYVEGDVMKKRKVRYEMRAAPTTGTWNTGDLAYNNAPAAGGFIGWVCVAGGSPGQWRAFGFIES
jgi:hypothetical protein